MILRCPLLIILVSSSSVWIDRSQKLFPGLESMITLEKDITLSLKEPHNCLSVSQGPKNGVNEAKLDLKIVKCSQPQSTICIRQKNDPVDVISAPPPPRFPCQSKASEKRTSEHTRRKRNVGGTLI